MEIINRKQNNVVAAPESKLMQLNMLIKTKHKNFDKLIINTKT